MDADQGELDFNRNTARLLHRKASRRAAAQLNTTSAPGLESALARISAEATEAAADRLADKAAAKI